MNGKEAGKAFAAMLAAADEETKAKVEATRARFAAIAALGPAMEEAAREWEKRYGRPFPRSWEELLTLAGYLDPERKWFLDDTPIADFLRVAEGILERGRKPDPVVTKEQLCKLLDVKPQTLANQKPPYPRSGPWPYLLIREWVVGHKTHKARTFLFPENPAEFSPP